MFIQDHEKLIHDITSKNVGLVTTVYPQAKYNERIGQKTGREHNRKNQEWWSTDQGFQREDFQFPATAGYVIWTNPSAENNEKNAEYNKYLSNSHKELIR